MPPKITHKMALQPPQEMPKEAPSAASSTETIPQAVDLADRAALRERLTAFCRHYLQPLLRPGDDSKASTDTAPIAWDAHALYVERVYPMADGHSGLTYGFDLQLDDLAHGNVAQDQASCLLEQAAIGGIAEAPARAPARAPAGTIALFGAASFAGWGEAPREHRCLPAGTAVARFVRRWDARPQGTLGRQTRG